MAPWRYVELDGDGIDEQIQHVCAAERVAVYNLTASGVSAALIRIAEDRHRLC
ncbi:hypothetical protein I553_8934 [Mycobacterium xenopi 4042]|uniref:Uncharacterized protein n=1 Tax=Mycobacterium xenopi 4042 TaxID=1299334 RepID=X8CNQ9_MYCXE|nr:hypothetical protein I553_8934 [Mycobacterium xenopi 4042]